MQLQLTYIPAQYWTAQITEFTLLSKGQSPPKESGFFLLWLPECNSEQDLHTQATRIFPQIPVSKLLTCQILLAYPSDNAFLLKPTVGKIIPIPPLIKILNKLEIVDLQDRTQKRIMYSESIKTWAFLTKFTFELLSRGNFVPILDPINEKQFEGHWHVFLKTPFDHTRYKTILRNTAWVAYNLPADFIPVTSADEKKKQYQAHSLWHSAYIFTNYMDTIADYLIRLSLSKEFNAKFESKFGITLDNSCSMDEQITWDLRFLRACIGKNHIFEITKFCDTPIPNILRNWVQNSQGFSFELGVNFTLRLEYPKETNEEWNLAYYIQPIQHPENFIPLKDLWSGTITHNEKFATACDDENLLQEEILRALGTAGKYFPPIGRSLESKNPQYVKLNTNEVMDLIRTSMFLLIQAGFNVILPDEFTAQGQQRLSARVVIEPKKKTRVKGSAANVRMFDMDSVLEYHWEAQLEGKQLTDQEFLELANAKEPLIFWRDQWVLVDQQDMETLKPIFEKKGDTKLGMAVRGELNYFEALKLGMTGEIQLNENGPKFAVKLEEAFNDLITRISSIENFETISCPAGFTGKLRPYQETALTWLSNMTKYHFGICLADDMGLGKTIEIIVFLIHRADNNLKEKGSTLIICPTSVLFNWKRELQKFAPSLDIFIHYGPERFKDISGIKELSKAHRIVLTTYGTVRNDSELLTSIHFQGIIVDESQNMKNYKTHQAQVINNLKGGYRIALSGTPIENRMLELWSLFEFLNPGLLGTRTEFQSKFILPIERYRDEEITAKFKRIISPFILRRLKTDKTIIQDLPEKNEIKVFLELSPIQKQLYQKTVDTTLKLVEESKEDTFKRRGLILKLLVQLKQITDHPYLFQHVKVESFDDDPSKEEEIGVGTKPNSQGLDSSNINFDEFIEQSQKLERLLEMIDEILERGEKLILFTQFRQMGEIIQKTIERKYNFSVLFFHGGVPEKQRHKIVDEFQSTEIESPPILILSLRAGGTGLNLTQAQVVFHFDRWWNPAVENQATDRAYRIGQTKQVNVYKFISEGTIEEKIDTMLEEKRELANKLISSAGETWITDLSDTDLHELFSLKE